MLLVYAHQIPKLKNQIYQNTLQIFYSLLEYVEQFLMVKSVAVIQNNHTQHDYIDSIHLQLRQKNLLYLRIARQNV